MAVGGGGTKDVRERRRRAVVELIRVGSLTNQDELVAKLRGQGFAVTQATVSRDLDHIGAVKIRKGGAISYALPDAVGISDWAGRRVASLVAEWARSIEPAGNLVVITTPPGLAHLIGVALDQAELPDVVGTICGDDTLFVAARSPQQATALAKRLSDSSNQGVISPLRQPFRAVGRSPRRPPAR